MRTDIVSAEVELTVAANQIARYADFLAESIQAYVKILIQLQERGIQDDLVCAKLSDIAIKVAPAIKKLDNEGTEIRITIANYISEVEKAEKIAFPTGIVDIIRSLFAQLV